eukprot:gb/GFBE01053448.1/.p1 GENE.gb/GFBE01053448.1/~~gb/GFBE01053448.1/.p1  ORF type:complete len:365 (+),score=97.09 gb/GFBE01053448.1/:1-1095(+)
MFCCNDQPRSDFEQVQIEDLKTPTYVEKPLKNRLEDAFQLNFPFIDVDIDTYNFDKDKCALQAEGVTNAQKIASLLNEDPTLCVKILGYTGPGTADGSTLMRLSLERARAIRTVLTEAGCINKVAAKGLGHADSQGPRCEIALCLAPEADAIEAEALELETQAKAALQEAAEAAEREALEAEAKARGPPPGPRTFEIDGERTGKDSFGLVFDCQDGKLPVIKTVQLGGMVDAWNSKAPLDKCVGVGMALSAVNGHTLFGKEMITKLNMQGCWTLTIKVPKEFMVTLKKGSQETLGLDLLQSRVDHGIALLVQNTSGQSAAAGIKPNDRIVEVNGQTGTPSELLSTLLAADADVVLKVHSFAAEA